MTPGTGCEGDYVRNGKPKVGSVGDSIQKLVAKLIIMTKDQP
jgi:hypothetical protein